MKRYTTRISYVIIATFSTSAFSCKKEPDELIQRATYVYVNRLAEPVRFELYNTEDKSSVEYLLKQNDSIEFIVSGIPGVFPFHMNEVFNRTGDSVVFRFGNGLCTSYKREKATGTFGGTGVFDLTKYENYNSQVINQKVYSLRYVIDGKDYLLADNCGFEL